MARRRPTALLLLAIGVLGCELAARWTGAAAVDVSTADVATQPFDPHARDFGAACHQMALLGKKYCDSFDYCCDMRVSGESECIRRGDVGACDEQRQEGVCRARNCTDALPAPPTVAPEPEQDANHATSIFSYAGALVWLMVVSTMSLRLTKLT